MKLDYITLFDKWDDQKKFFCFTGEDAKCLSDFHHFAEADVDEIVDELYTHLLKFEEARMFFSSPETLLHVKMAQRSYFLELTSGSYDKDYYENRIKVGLTHHRMGVTPLLYMGAYSYYLQLLIPRIYHHLGSNHEKANATVEAMYKIINLDQQLTLSAYIQAAVEELKDQ